MLIADTPGWTEPVARLGAVALFGLVLPQVLGFLAYRCKRRQELRLRLPTVLIPPVVFFVASSVFWTLYAKAIQDSGRYVCGMFGLMASLTTLGGTLIHLILAVLVFLVTCFLAARRGLKKATYTPP